MSDPLQCSPPCGVGRVTLRSTLTRTMSDDNKSTLNQIAEEVGEIVEEQEDDENKKSAREGEEFDPEDYERNKEDYDGGW